MCERVYNGPARGTARPKACVRVVDRSDSTGKVEKAGTLGSHRCCVRFPPEGNEEPLEGNGQV